MQFLSQGKEKYSEVHKYDNRKLGSTYLIRESKVFIKDQSGVAFSFSVYIWSLMFLSCTFSVVSDLRYL